MRFIAVYVCLALLLVMARAVAVPLVGVYADLILLVPGFWLWSRGQTSSSFVLVLVGSFVIDLTSSQGLPITLITTVISGLVYLVVLAPTLAGDTVLMRIVGLSVWLLLWRLARFALLGAGWLSGLSLISPRFLSWYDLIIWIAVGLSLWGMLVGLSKLAEKIRWLNLKNP